MQKGDENIKRRDFSESRFYQCDSCSSQPNS